MLRPTRPLPCVRPGFFALCLALLPAGLVRADCRHIEDPLQVLDFFIEMDPADWDIVRLDDTFSTERPAMFRACDEAPLPARVRRKQLLVFPADPDRVKVSLKIDFDDRVSGGEWHGRRKLSLESGRGLGFGRVLREAFAWQLMAHAGLVVGTATWVNVHVNGQNVGVYASVEEMDKSFLRRRLGEDDGFLYKIDYTLPDRRKRLTREGEEDPYAANLCYSPFGETCAMPPDSFATLPLYLDVHQLFTLAAVNGFISNYDAPFIAENNYYWYNSTRPRMYFPWDLDLVLLNGFEQLDPFAPRETSDWTSVLLGDAALREYYDLVLSRLVYDAFSSEVLDRFLDELAPIIGPPIDADPFNDFDGSFAQELEKLRTWLHKRVEVLRSWLPSPQPFPVVINEILALNASVNTDEGGRFGDWVELFNGGAQPASLLGLYLSDDPAEPRKWRLPDAQLPAGGHLLVWCDRGVGEGPFHAGFALDAGGEGLGLYEAADRSPPGLYRAVDFVRFGPQETDVSLGRFPDGAPGFRRLACPTPAAPNRLECAPPRPPFIRSDVNGDGAVNITDAVRLLLGLFAGVSLPCESAADADDDGSVVLTDAIVILAHLFQSAPSPRPPFPGCGPDPTADSLGCEIRPRC